jgi:hypothetical protein
VNEAAGIALIDLPQNESFLHRGKVCKKLRQDDETARSKILAFNWDEGELFTLGPQVIVTRAIGLQESVRSLRHLMRFPHTFV